MACCGCGSGVDDYGDDEDNVGDDDGDCHFLLLGGRLVVVVVDGGVGRAQAIFQLVVSFFKWVAFVIFNLFFCGSSGKNLSHFGLLRTFFINPGHVPHLNTF